MALVATLIANPSNPVLTPALGEATLAGGSGNFGISGGGVAIAGGVLAAGVVLTISVKGRNSWAGFQSELSRQG